MLYDHAFDYVPNGSCIRGTRLDGSEDPLAVSSCWTLEGEDLTPTVLSYYAFPDNEVSLDSYSLASSVTPGMHRTWQCDTTIEDYDDGSDSSAFQ